MATTQIRKQALRDNHLAGGIVGRHVVMLAQWRHCHTVLILVLVRTLVDFSIEQALPPGGQEGSDSLDLWRREVLQPHQKEGTRPARRVEDRLGAVDVASV
ncbi:MAG TPA: hypothetical protein VH478_07495 [Trebonia sp.]|nr:hypothetical protein [Trebonia sp.]